MTQETTEAPALAENEFDLATLISSMDGHLVSSIDEVHRLIEFVAGYPVWTHQMPRVSREIVEPALRAQFPVLAEIHPPAFSEIPGWEDGSREDRKRIIDTWIEGLIASADPALKPTYVVEPVLDAPEPKDPLSELLDYVDPDRVVVIEVSGQ